MKNQASDDIEHYGRYSYYIETKLYAKDYNDAKKQCKRKDMQLATIKNQETLKFLLSKFDKNSFVGKCNKYLSIVVMTNRIILFSIVKQIYEQNMRKILFENITLFYVFKSGT